MPQEKYIVITGNVVDGLNFIGPFDDFNDAEEYAFDVSEEWSITELTNPEE